MIDFMLKNPRIPALSMDGSRLPSMVEAMDLNSSCPRHNRPITGNAQTSFEEFHSFALMNCDLRVYDDMEGNIRPFQFREAIRWETPRIHPLVLDNGELHRAANLWCGKPNPQRLTQGSPHLLNEGLNTRLKDLFS